jgi:hypothetical protein
MRVLANMAGISKPAKVVIRTLDPADPRSLDHPSHREAWLRLADAIGRMEAREIIKRQGKGKADEGRQG